jgi:predicted RecA/RadA family phage recombinase
MSALIGANTAIPAGEITWLPDEGVRRLDALTGDTITKGAVLFNDYANATPSSRGYKVCGTSGAERGPYAVAVSDKATGKVKVDAVRRGKVTVVAGNAIAGGAFVKPSAVTAGAVDQLAITGTSPDNQGLCVGQYVKLAKYANSNDGNHALAAASAGDIIVIDLDVKT